MSLIVGLFVHHEILRTRCHGYRRGHREPFNQISFILYKGLKDMTRQDFFFLMEGKYMSILSLPMMRVGFQDTHHHKYL